jgi:hypothetical protein
LIPYDRFFFFSFLAFQQRAHIMQLRENIKAASMKRKELNALLDKWYQEEMTSTGQDDKKIVSLIANLKHLCMFLFLFCIVWYCFVFYLFLF